MPLSLRTSHCLSTASVQLISSISPSLPPSTIVFSNGCPGRFWEWDLSSLSILPTWLLCKKQVRRKGGRVSRSFPDHLSESIWGKFMAIVEWQGVSRPGRASRQAASLGEQVGGCGVQGISWSTLPGPETSAGLMAGPLTERYLRKEKYTFDGSGWTYELWAAKQTLKMTGILWEAALGWEKSMCADVSH